MPHIVRFADHTGTTRVGTRDERGDIRPFDGVQRVADLLRMSSADLRTLVADVGAERPSWRERDVLLLPPLDGRMELWAAGVTYERSREARVAESTEQSIYERIYDAERPELFFKAVPWRIVTDGEPIAVRDDSALNVPEPELGLVTNRDGEVVGYVIVNDVSSRSIEGENPLYLPQAKVYAGSCAVSAAILPAWEVADAAALEIGLVVRREGRIAFQGATSTSAFHRSPRELLDHLLFGQPFPDGAVLATGTGIVPDLDFTLHAGDVVEIAIEGVGTLTNSVLADRAGFDWLAEAADHPLARRAVRGSQRREEAR